MSVAAKVGRGLGRGLGRTAAFAWKGTVYMAEATGEFGEAALDGATTGWDDQCLKMDEARELRKAKLTALKAAQEAPAIAAPARAKKAVAA